MGRVREKPVGSFTYPGDFDPSLHHFGPLLGLQHPVPEAGGDDAIGNAVELGDGGPDAGGQMFLPLLVPLRPDATEAVIRHHFLKELLHREKG